MSLLVNNIFVIVAAVLSGFSQMAKSFEMIMLSRFLTGVNAGMRCAGMGNLTGQKLSEVSIRNGRYLNRNDQNNLSSSLSRCEIKGLGK